MAPYKRQIALILLLAVAAIACGIYSTYINMQNITMCPVDDPFDIRWQQGVVDVKLLGWAFSLSKQSLEKEKILSAAKEILSRVPPFFEIKFSILKDNLEGMLNIK